MNKGMNMNEMVKYSSLAHQPDIDDYILLYFMKGNDYRCVVSVSETCTTLRARANQCSQDLFKMSLRDRLIENVIVMYTINHYASITDHYGLGLMVLITSPDMIKIFGQKARARYGVENRQDILSFTNNSDDRKRLLETLDIVESFVKQTFDPEDQEKVDKLCFFFWYASVGCPPAAYSMLMLNLLSKTIQANRQNCDFCCKLIGAVETIYSALVYTHKGSKQYIAFSEHREMLESILALNPKTIANSNQNNVEENIDGISDIIERKGGIILLGIIVGYYSLRWFFKND